MNKQKTLIESIFNELKTDYDLNFAKKLADLLNVCYYRCNDAQKQKIREMVEFNGD